MSLGNERIWKNLSVSCNTEIVYVDLLMQLWGSVGLSTGTEKVANKH